MNKKIIILAILVIIGVMTVLLCKYWPTRKQVVDTTIDVYIKIFCEK